VLSDKLFGMLILKYFWYLRPTFIIVPCKGISLSVFAHPKNDIQSTLLASRAKSARARSTGRYRGSSAFENRQISRWLASIGRASSFTMLRVAEERSTTYADQYFWCCRSPFYLQPAFPLATVCPHTLIQSGVERHAEQTAQQFRQALQICSPVLLVNLCESNLKCKHL